MTPFSSANFFASGEALIIVSFKDSALGKADGLLLEDCGEGGGTTTGCGERGGTVDGIRSSVGVALDWMSPIGPMNFTLAYPVTKKNGDKTETFRFNLGTNF